MKKTKKFLSVFLALMMIISIIPMASIEVEAATYNASAAVSFANLHWNDGVGLCAEFVSRCLNAGGVTIPNRAYYSSSTQSYKNNSGTLGAYTNPYTCSASLLLYLSEKYPIITNPSSSDIEIGDVVFMYGGSSGQWKDGHVGIVISKTNGVPVYAAHNRATNSGKFSSSYPCTYVAKMNGSIISHQIDSNYGKNFTAYPKAKITAENIFDAYHTQISSSAWIGTSDECTIHEVYTDGCCKVTYPLDSGGTKTVYSKISLFNTHTHSYTEYYEAAHPHKIYKKCSCGEWYYTGDTKTVSSCSTCTHTHSYTTTKVVTAPTCTTKGLKKKFCSCGASKIAGLIDALGHDYTGEKVHEGAHPHEISQRCVRYDSCGSFVWTGENAVINSCSNCLAENPKKIYASTNSVNLKLGETESTTVYVWTGGIHNNPCVLNWQTSNSNVSCSWGEWNSEGKLPLTITAKAKGSTVVTLSVKDKNSDSVLHSIKINVNVDAKTYTVKYDANGGTGAPSNQTKYHNTPLTLSSTKPTRTGYTFLGWTISSTATTVIYSAGSSYTTNLNVTLYAVWKPNAYIVKFNANGGTGTMSNQSFTYDAAKALTANSFTRTGYTFLGWSTSSTATSATYTDGQSVKNLTATDGGTVNLYAVWRKNPTTSYTLSYNANGGTGAPSAQSGSTLYVISSTIPQKAGYTFMGWSSVYPSDTADFQPNEMILITADTTLYAVWQKNIVAPETNFTFSIQEPSTTTIRNKDGIILHANIEGNAPAGSYVVWTSNNSNFDEDADGNDLTVIAKNKGYTTFTATLYDAGGNVLATDSVELYSNSGFFQKIGGFFRSLFGTTKIYEN